MYDEFAGGKCITVSLPSRPPDVPINQFIYDFAVYDDSFFIVYLACELCCTTSADLACGHSSNLQLERQEFAVFMLKWPWIFNQQNQWSQDPTFC